MNHAADLPSGPAELQLVPFDERHLAGGLALSQAQSWPYRIEDWTFAAALGRGFVVEAEGRVVGTALWWPYGDRFASTGMIIVADDMQRRGIGARLMDALLADVAGRSIVLVSTLEGETLYRRLGWVPRGQIEQRQALLAAAPTADPGRATRIAGPGDRAAIIALDGAASGMEREHLVQAVLDMAETRVIERGGALAGYGCVRRWGRGYVIGPVAAPDAEDAKALIAALAAGHVGDFVRIDVMTGGGLSEWLEANGLPETSRGLSMVRGEAPQSAPGAALFALSNQSLG